MAKYLVFLFLYVLTIANAFSQRQNVYFFNKKNIEVQERDSAEYLRIVSEPTSGSTLYPINEYFIDGTRKSIGFSSRISPPLYEGQFIEYRKDKKYRLANFNKGKLSGHEYTYFPNGKLYSILSYREPSKDAIGPEEPSQIVQLNDSTGNEMVVNGNGIGAFFDDSLKVVTDKGTVKDGLKDGTWTGKSSSGKLTYTENYVNGKLMSGESIDDEGKRYQYTEDMQPPEFKGTIKNFYSYLKRNVIYPASCLKAGITGVVYLRFTVKSDGSIADIKVINIVHPDLAKEALRVMKASPKWMPGTLKGKPANVLFNLPVSFNL